MTIDMSQFYQVFFDEAAEHLANMEGLLLALDVDAPSLDDLNAIFRAAHSIKGGSGTFGFSDMTEVTHVLETLLDRLRKEELRLVPEMVDAFLAAGDVLHTQLQHHQGGPCADPGRVAEVCGRLARLSSGEQVNTAAGQPTGEPVRYWLECSLSPRLAADAHQIDNLLAALGEVAACELRQRPTAETPRLALWLTTAHGEADLREILAFYVAPEDVRLDGGGTMPVEAYGLFDEAPASAPAEEGFGLFADAPGTPPPATAGEAAFGFFDAAPGAPAATPAAGPAREGDGFGFFSDAPGTPAPAPAEAAAAPAMASHGRRATDNPTVETARSGRRENDKVVSGAASEASSIRVSVEKVDQMINLVGELVITQAMLAEAAAQLDPAHAERLLSGIDLLSRNTRDLQESVMSIRMLPMSMVFSRFPRLVRDLAGKLGKQVELKTVGENTELDKGLIEKITDPLTHLVRNSLDHGIETPERRVAAGKSPKGTLTLKASHQGGNIVIEVMDDGGGLNRERILAKA
ncbi:MAG: Hpt domain-containing protein, partial [Thiobacillaceae bacterium]|nr:Hpt domain-containing protein [Thiobacillaceae bacterium]